MDFYTAMKTSGAYITLMRKKEMKEKLQITNKEAHKTNTGNNELKGDKTEKELIPHI
jgi:hypothetical protein